MKCKFAIVIAWLVPLIFGTARAYEVPTHRDLSNAAAQKSVLAQPSVLTNLGLKAIDDPTQRFPSTGGPTSTKLDQECKRSTVLTVLELIRCGGQFEDLPTTNSLNHFFDPQNNGRPLTTVPALPFQTFPSPAWSLEDAGVLTGQLFSYRDAREYFYNALVLPSASDRSTNWGKLFQTMGQVLHHLQDMAQPQHVRNDPHCDQIIPCAIPLAIVNAYKPSRYEKYTQSLDQQIFTMANLADGNLVYPGPGGANIATFNTPRKFFIGSDKGIAEFTSKNFVSEGTQFTYNGGVAGPNPLYPAPVPGQPTDAALSELYPDGLPLFLSAACNIVPTQCYLTFYPTSGTDPLTNQPFTNPRASTFSIYDSDLTFYGGTLQTAPATGEQWSTERVFSLNHFNFAEAHNLLIGRAVSYSAGLINYFFRGKLEIGLPAEGVHALADHSLAAVYTKDTGGFTKIKLKLKNVTPGPSGTVEPIQDGGNLQAVVKFRRNACYEPPKLLGQPGAPGYGAGCKSNVEELVLSGTVTPDETQRNAINSVAGLDLAFDFTTQNVIPINATDVRLQVIYKGALGAETDAVIVATKDISEPTLYNFDNYSDCQVTPDGKVYTIPPPAGQLLSASMSFNNGATYNASVSDLPPGAMRALPCWRRITWSR